MGQLCDPFERKCVCVGGETIMDSSCQLELETVQPMKRTLYYMTAFILFVAIRRILKSSKIEFLYKMSKERHKSKSA